MTALFSQGSTRNGDLDEFFRHELMECLQARITPQSEVPGGIDASIIDGAAVVNMIKLGMEKSFSGPYVKAQLRYVKRVDIVWDKYIENSLKATTRPD